MEFLKQEFLDRKGRRPAYSERAFARDLRVSPGYISLLFRGLRTLSPAKGIQIAQRLGWPEEKTNHFVGMIQKQSLTKSSISSKREGGVTKFTELELDRFRFIADLNHLATLTLLKSHAVEDAKQIARLLDISQVEADLVVARLVRLGLVGNYKGKLRCSNNSLEIKDWPSEAIRTFHRQAIQKAEESIEGQSVEMRNLAALTLAFDGNQMEEAKAHINRFLKSFLKKFGHAKSGEVYQLNTQFFSLTRGRS